ncbi:Xylose isomerase domain-containing protein TIM barrel [Emticicia oligotrophica DSM 17448]|uniref:Xylose isomerase domain-containing protein TIM barrel n=1 Tax=Emticicia oligotrophica (strain DSM 17448 / CIP 109782 / MTCC 6937 / GPTSA100-15) TaxID=929562 RepID=A0ABN4AKP4_EMTOG|nr:sugar phosphate isomerase/epimerase [Emticicia oligotrophica]AFK02383.1 Xylose isomerase domain-containing protein TIM barrel [Emticicia oligotrophica DSM 17448]
MKNQLSRRDFISVAPMATLGLLLSKNKINWLDKPNSKFGGVQIGAITYSFRSMPHDIDQLLQFCIDANVSAIEMMGDPAEDFAGKPKSPVKFSPPARGGQRPQLTDEQKAQLAEYGKQVAAWRASTSMDKFKEIRKKFNDAGVTIYAFKPNAFGANNTDAEIEYGMKAAKALGATSVTLELPTDSAQTKRLGDFGSKHKVYVGYHAHLQATDTLWDEALSQSPYNSMNLDCGHYIAVGGKNTKESLLALIQAKHDRITSMHIKDRTADGKGNLEWGKGDTPLKEILNLMKTKKYKFPATVELEYDVPEGSNAVKEVAKCVAYAKEILV